MTYDHERELRDRAKRLEKELKDLNEQADKIQFEKSYAHRSAIYGTPEWQREQMLKQERQLQADRDRMAMLEHGATELVSHVRKNGSIYGARMTSNLITPDNGNGQIIVSFTLKPH